MCHKLKLFLFLRLVCGSMVLHAQYYKFQRPLKVDGPGWYKFHIPAQLEAKCRKNFADLRIWAVQKNGDTIEAPYVVKDPNETIAIETIPLKVLNRSQKNGSFFYTLENTGRLNLEQVDLSFALKNFEWKIDLEGSHNQNEWFTLLSGYRILSISNYATNYSFCKLIFPESNYFYYRLRLPATEDPQLISASLYSNGTARGCMQNLKIVAQQSSIEKGTGNTIVMLQLEETLPVSYIRVYTAGKVDFLRDATLYTSVLSPDTKERVPDGFVLPHHQLSLSSLMPNIFRIPKTRANQIKLVVKNLDNIPLQIDSVTLKTMQQELWVQVPEAEKYFLVYGNEEAKLPQYDASGILLSTNPLPKTNGIIGGEQARHLAKTVGKTMLINNNITLYVIMVVIMGLLGYASVTMIRKKQSASH